MLILKLNTQEIGMTKNYIIYVQITKKVFIFFEILHHLNQIKIDI